MNCESLTFPTSPIPLPTPPHSTQGLILIERTYSHPSHRQTTNVQEVTSTAKLHAVSENLSFSRRVYVQNKVTDIYKFCQREIRFAGTCYVSFSYEPLARKHLKTLKDRK